MIDEIGIVNDGAYMEFKDATDALFERIDHEGLARELGVSVASVRQARLKESAAAHRAPPSNWRNGVLSLAKEHSARLSRLIEQLNADRPRAGAGAAAPKRSPSRPPQTQAAEQT